MSWCSHLCDFRMTDIHLVTTLWVTESPPEPSPALVIHKLTLPPSLWPCPWVNLAEILNLLPSVVLGFIWEAILTHALTHTHYQPLPSNYALLFFQTFITFIFPLEYKCCQCKNSVYFMLFYLQHHLQWYLAQSMYLNIYGIFRFRLL